MRYLAIFLLFTVGCTKQLELRGLITLIGDEKAEYPRSASGADGVSLAIDEMQPLLRGGELVTVSFQLGGRSQVRELNFTLITDDGFEDALLDLEASEVALTLPARSVDAKIRLRAVTKGDAVIVVDTNMFRVDGEAPVVTIAPVPPFVLADYDVAVAAADDDTITTLECALGNTFFVPLTGSSFTISTAIDAADTRVHCLAVDRVGNESLVTSNVFTVDATVPSAPNIEWVSEHPYTNERDAALAPSTCTTSEPVAAALVEFAGARPTASDPAWQACSTVALPVTLPDVDAAHVAHVWFKDAAGNVTATPVDAPITLDRLAPIVSLDAPNAGVTLLGGAALDVQTTASDANFAATPVTVELSTDGGASFTTLCPALAPSVPCSTTVPMIDVSLARYRVTAVDLAGNTTSVTHANNLLIDSSPPVVTAFQFAAPSGQTIAPVTPVSLTATDLVSSVDAVCVKVLAPGPHAAPAANDPCWIGVDEPLFGLTPALSVTIPEYDVFLDLIPGATFTAYAWAKDSTGKIAVLSNGTLGTDATDRSTVTLVSDPAPNVTDVVVSSDGVNQNARNIATGADLYVRWRAADNNMTAASPIAIYTTTDERTYTLLATAPNGPTGPSGVSGPCAVSGPQTGCTVIGAAAPSGYFRVRVTATDDNAQTSAQSSPAHNASKIRILAGNTDAGTDTTATKAFLFSRALAPSPDGHSFVVTRKGVVYLLDAQRGLMRIDPKSRTLSLFVAKGTTTSGVGDMGPPALALLRAPLGLALDDQDNLFIMDYDRVRKIDFQSMTIDTVIGGGGDAVSDTVAARSLQIAPNSSSSPTVPFFTLPNGDLYFVSDTTGGGTIAATNYRVRYYRRATGMVYALRPSGTGHTDGPSDDITQCGPRGFGIEYDPIAQAAKYGVFFLSAEDASFPNCTPTTTGNRSSLMLADPSTWQALTPPPPHAFGGFYDYYQASTTGQNGRLYFFSKGSFSGIKVLDTTASPPTWQLVVGNAGSDNGACADGTPALSCPVDPEDVFVTREGRLYYLARGQLRYLDGNGLVRTLYGDGFSGGDGGSPLSARFKRIGHFDRFATSGAMAVYDADEARLREVSTVVQTVAGDGTITGAPLDLSVGPTGQPFPAVSGLAYDNSGRVLITAAATNPPTVVPTRKYVLRLTPGAWSVAGGGSNLANADYDTPGTLPLTGPSGVDMTAARYWTVIGYDAGSDEAIIHYAQTDGVVLWDRLLKRLAFGANEQRDLAGVNDDMGSAQASQAWCPGVTGPTAATGCVTPAQGMMHAQRDTTRWLVASTRDATRLVALDAPFPGNAQVVATTAQAMAAFALHRSNGPEELVYCASNGTLRRRVLPAGPESVVTLPPSMTCDSNAMIYASPDAGAAYHRMIFAFSQYGLAGLAELDLSP